MDTLTIDKVKDLEAELQYYKDKYMSLTPDNPKYQATLTKIKYLQEKIDNLKE